MVGSAGFEPAESKTTDLQSAPLPIPEHLPVTSSTFSTTYAVASELESEMTVTRSFTGQGITVQTRTTLICGFGTKVGKVGRLVSSQRRQAPCLLFLPLKLLPTCTCKDQVAYCFPKLAKLRTVTWCQPVFGSFLASYKECLLSVSQRHALLWWNRWDSNPQLSV